MAAGGAGRISRGRKRACGSGRCAGGPAGLFRFRGASAAVCNETSLSLSWASTAHQASHFSLWVPSTPVVWGLWGGIFSSAAPFAFAAKARISRLVAATACSCRLAAVAVKARGRIAGLNMLIARRVSLTIWHLPRFDQIRSTSRSNRVE